MSSRYQLLAFACILSFCLAPSAACATTYRGVNITPELVGDGDIAVLARDWNANLVRICLAGQTRCSAFMFSDVTSGRCSAHDLEELDHLIDTCEEQGLRVIVDLHQFAGYFYLDQYEEVQNMRLWSNLSLQEALIAFWRTIAARYAERGDVIYGYNLLNEPHAPATETWLGLAKRITTAIREVDRSHAIIVESRDGVPESFSELRPTGDPNTIYSFHLWQPIEFTHQGIWGNPIGADYPNGTWNKQYLVDVLRPVVEFQRRYGVPVLAGEVGVYAVVPPASRAAYLRDALGLFEDYGYDYALWAYRETTDSSLEHGRYLMTGVGYAPYYEKEGTPALEVFREYLERNDTPRPSTAVNPKPRCLFDTAHWSAMAADTNAWSMNLAWRLAGSCDVVDFTSGKITPDALTGTALLVSGNPYGELHSADEREAIRRFVEGGGAFLFYMNNVKAPSLVGGVNALLSNFGIHFDGTLIASPEPAWPGAESTVYWTQTFNRDHPVGRESSSYFVSSGGSLTLTPPAVSVAETGAGTWRDSNGNLKADVGEVKGPFCIIAASEYGQGRVVVIADDDFKERCNWQVQALIVRWLLGEGNAD